MSRVCALTFLLVVLLGVSRVAAAPLPNGGLDGAEDFVQLASEGFRHGVDGSHPEGSTQNTYAWSGAWFRGKLYVGTGRNLNCLRSSRGLPGCPASGFPGPDDRAEIWAYTPAGKGGVDGSWERVHQAALLNVPVAGNVPRDIGYRGMAVCAAGGPERLWVGTLGAGGRLLWSGDGHAFTDASSLGLHNSLAELLAGTADLGYRALACWKGRLLAAPVAGGKDGDVPANPIVLANDDPGEPTSRWDTIVNVQTEPGIGDPNNLGVFSMTAYRDAVYLGVTNLTTGFEIWRGTGCDSPPRPCVFAWERLVENGANRPHAPLTKIKSGGVTDAAGFRGAVYFGVSSSSTFGGTSAELVRVNADGTFDLVMGIPRMRATMPGSFNCSPDPDDPKRCVPLSGMGPGFGTAAGYESGSAVYVWRLTAFRGHLYAGLASESQPLMRTRDGEKWQLVKPAGFLARGATAVRTLVAAPGWPGGPALAFGTVGGSGPGEGLQVWVGSCAPSTPPVAVATAGLPDAGSSLPGVKLAMAGADGHAAVTLDGSASFSPHCGRVTTYEWYEENLVGRGRAGTVPIARGAQADVELPAGADFEDHVFTLRVVDDEGREDRATLTVRASRNAAPTVEVESIPAAALEAGRLRLNLLDVGDDDVESFTLSGRCDDPEGALVSCRWRTRGNVTLANQASLATVGTVALSTDRSAAVSLVATDDHGYETTTTIPIRVRRHDRDVAIEAITTGSAAAGQPQPVAVTVRNDGDLIETTSVSVVDRTGGLVSSAQSITLAPGAAGDVTFQWTPSSPGAHALAVSVATVPDERIVIDNDRYVVVDVRPP